VTAGKDGRGAWAAISCHPGGLPNLCGASPHVAESACSTLASGVRNVTDTRGLLWECGDTSQPTIAALGGDVMMGTIVGLILILCAVLVLWNSLFGTSFETVAFAALGAYAGVLELRRSKARRAKKAAQEADPGT
jgi:hypothetical protein